MKVLIIEDDPPIMEMVTMALSTDGHEIRASYDLEALIWAREGWPDVILLDLMLPYLPGASMLSYLHNRGITERIPVIVMTAIRKAFPSTSMLGARAVLEKPFSLAELDAAVAAVTKKEES